LRVQRNHFILFSSEIKYENTYGIDLYVCSVFMWLFILYE